MRAARIVVIAVALVAAIGVVVLMRGIGISGNTKADAAPLEQPMTQVLVAKRDLPVGTKLQTGDLGWEPWPATSVNPAFITTGGPPTPAAETKIEKAAQAIQTAAVGAQPMEALYGAIVREPLLTGEPIVARKIVRGGEGGFMAVMLQPGMRAMGVTVSTETGAGGFILPGDRVDVLQSRPVNPGGAPGGAPSTVTQVVLQNVRVLAIDQKTQPDKDSQTVVGAVATLEVTNESAAALVEAKSVGRPMILALRSYADLGGPSGVGPQTMRQRTSTVRVYRDGQVSEVGTAQ